MVSSIEKMADWSHIFHPTGNLSVSTGEKENCADLRSWTCQTSSKGANYVTDLIIASSSDIEAGGGEAAFGRSILEEAFRASSKCKVDEHVFHNTKR